MRHNLKKYGCLLVFVFKLRLILLNGIYKKDSLKNFILHNLKKNTTIITYEHFGMNVYITFDIFTKIWAFL